MSFLPARLASYREDPVRFVFEEFKIEPDKWQRMALRAFASKDVEKQRIAMQACAGPGKSAVLAWIGWLFLSCYWENQSHPKGACVSITSDNLRDNLWAEFSKWQARSPVLEKMFEWQAERIINRAYPEDWFLSARSFSKTASAEEQGRTLSGLHAEYILYLIDEAGDISPAVLRAAEQGLSNCKFGKIVAAGNPTSTDGMLHFMVTNASHRTFVVRITGDPDDPMRSSRIDKAWAADQIAQYGKENPWVMAYILGLFPPQGINTLLGPDDVRAAMERQLQDEEYSWAAPVVGVDVARFGDDRTVIFPRQGLRAWEPEVLRHAKTQEIAGRVIATKKSGNAAMIFVDETGGWGAGVIDALALGKHPVVGVNFSSKADNPKYFNKRSEIIWEAAEWVKRGGWLPNMPELVREATAPTYWFDKGKLRVEEKEQIKKRIGCSPDLWDALCVTFAMPIAPESEGGISSGFGAQAPEVSDEDY